MAELIDLSEIQKSIDGMIARSANLIVGNGIENVIARLQIDVEGPMAIWRAKEINLRSDPNLVAEAIITSFVASIFGEVKQSLGHQPIEVLAEAINRVMVNVAEKFAAALMVDDKEWKKISTRVDAQEVGTA